MAAEVLAPAYQTETKLEQVTHLKNLDFPCHCSYKNIYLFISSTIPDFLCNGFE